MSFRVEHIDGFDDLSEHDKAELRRFETMLCTRDKLTKDANARLEFMQDTGKARIGDQDQVTRETVVRVLAPPAR